MLRGDQPLIGVGRRHLDVDHCHVRAAVLNQSDQLVGVLGLGDDLDVCVLEEPDDALAREQESSATTTRMGSPRSACRR